MCHQSRKAWCLPDGVLLLWGAWVLWIKGSFSSVIFMDARSTVCLSGSETDTQVTTELYIIRRAISDGVGKKCPMTISHLHAS
jgi:hypothetical protein